MTSVTGSQSLSFAKSRIVPTAMRSALSAFPWLVHDGMPDVLGHARDRYAGRTVAIVAQGIPPPAGFGDCQVSLQGRKIAKAKSLRFVLLAS